MSAPDTKRRARVRALLRPVLAAMLVVNALVMTACATAAPGAFDQGFNFVDWSPAGYASAEAKQSLDQLRATGANAIAITPTWYQASASATTITPDPALSPTDDAIASVIAAAKARHLKVLLRPVVDEQGDTPRSGFTPSSTQEWFASYRTFIDHYAALAQRLGVDMLSVGHEYHSLDGPAFEAQWRAIIAGVRERFRGPLTYGANNADAWTHVRFWDALDVIGIDAYFSLSNSGMPDVPAIVAAWHDFTDAGGDTHHYLDEMAALSAQYGKPISLTELGYPSASNALTEPWAVGRAYSGVAQDRAFRAASQALAGQPWLSGVYIWDWMVDPSAGGPGDTGHTPQNKPAERTIHDWFTASPSANRAVGIRLVRASLRRGVLTVRGALSRRVSGRVRVVYASRAERRPIRLVRGGKARRGRFTVRFRLPAAVRTPQRARRGTLVIRYLGAGGVAPSTASFSLTKRSAH